MGHHNNRWIVTVADCTIGVNVNILIIVFGANHIENNGVFYQTQAIAHSSFVYTDALQTKTFTFDQYKY